jgi:hypothetical protein
MHLWGIWNYDPGDHVAAIARFIENDLQGPDSSKIFTTAIVKPLWPILLRERFRRSCPTFHGFNPASKRFTVSTRDRCYDFKNIFAEKNCKKSAFLTRNKAKLCKILIVTFIFEKNANFFYENWQKLQKIVIITSTPGWPDEFAKKSPQMESNPFFGKINTSLCGKRSTKIWGYFCN